MDSFNDMLSSGKSAEELALAAPGLLFVEVGDEADNGLPYIHFILWCDKDKKSLPSAPISDIVVYDIPMESTEMHNGVFKYSGGMTLLRLQKELINNGFSLSNPKAVGDIEGVDKTSTMVDDSDLSLIDKNTGLAGMSKFTEESYVWSMEEKEIIDSVKSLLTYVSDADFDVDEAYDMVDVYRKSMDDYSAGLVSKYKVKTEQLLPTDVFLRLVALDTVSHEYFDEAYKTIKEKRKVLIEEEEKSKNGQVSNTGTADVTEEDILDFEAYMKSIEDNFSVTESVDTDGIMLFGEFVK